MYAIIDIGSNTIRLNVYQVEEDGAIHSIFQSKGDGPAWPAMFWEDGSMSQEGLDRAADALLRFRSILDALHIEKAGGLRHRLSAQYYQQRGGGLPAQERTGLMIRLLPAGRRPS